jgi:hypothetical protein
MSSTIPNAPVEIGADRSPNRPEQLDDCLPRYARLSLSCDPVRKIELQEKVSGIFAEHLAVDHTELIAFDQLDAVNKKIAWSFDFLIRHVRSFKFKDVRVTRSMAKLYLNEIKSFQSSVHEAINNLHECLAELMDFAVSLQKGKTT